MDDTQKKDGLEPAQEIPGGNTGEPVKEPVLEEPGTDGVLPDNVAALSDEIQDEDGAFLENGAQGYDSQFGELTDGQAEASVLAAPVKTKKRRFLMPCIIIAIVIFVLAAASGAAFLVLHNTPAGVWAVEGSEEAGAYYVFDNNGVAQMVTGTVSYKGTYSLQEATGDSGQKINLYIPVGYSAIQGDFDYTLTGNIFTGRKFVISAGEGQELKLVSSALPENTLEPAKDRKTDDKLIGSWKLKDSQNSVTYTLNADGTIVLESDSMRIAGVYTIKDGKIVTTYVMAGQNNDMEETYSFDKDTLLINGSGFEKVK